MDKKVLLISPKFPEKFGRLNIPMGLMHVGSYLLHSGYKVRILDLHNIGDRRQCFSEIKHELPGAIAVGLSVMSAQIPNAIEISKEVRQLDPAIPIIWGGVHPTLYPEQVAQHEDVDFAVKGEGEISAFELLKVIKQKGNRESVKGIAFRSNEHQKVVVTSNRELMDINELPPIDWRLLEDLQPGSDLQKIAQLSGRVFLLNSRGCPHRCAFCINAILKLGYRYRKADLVLQDVERLLDLGLDRIWFLDEDFFARGKKRVQELMEGIGDRGLKFKWFANVRADYFRAGYIDREFVLEMKRSGCEMVGIGAESGSQKILDMLKKDITVEDTLNAARLLDEARIKANFSFMIGLPGEDDDDVKRTLQLIEQIAEMSTSFRIIGPQVYRPYPGSELYSQCLAYGMREPATVDEWARSPYIQSEISSKDSGEYPWIKHRSLEDINNIAFYGQLLGVRSRYQFLTRIARRIVSLRCKRLYFKYPVEKKIYSLLVRTGAGKFLRPPVL